MAKGLAKSRSELLANEGADGVGAGGGFGCDGGGDGEDTGAAGAGAAFVGGESSTKLLNAATSFSSSTIMQTNCENTDCLVQNLIRSDKIDGTYFAYRNFSSTSRYQDLSQVPFFRRLEAHSGFIGFNFC